MSGKRAKALRRAFAALHDRKPHHGRCVRTFTGSSVDVAPPTRIRSMKARIAAVVTAGLAALGLSEKVARARKKAAAIVERFQRALFTMEIVEASEWRRLKKGKLGASPTRTPKEIRNQRVEENNVRIVDTRSHHNQASGKMKRAGVYATRQVRT